MSRTCFVFLSFWILACGVATGHADARRPKDFGKQWVRTHPFTIMALTQRSGALADDKYTRAGMGTLLVWKRWSKLCEAAVRLGIPWHLHVRKGRLLTDELKAQIKEVCRAYPGCTGFIVWDEPRRPQMKPAGEIVAWLKQTFPDKLVYSNAYPFGASGGKYYGARWMSSGVYEAPPGGYSYENYVEDMIGIIQPDVFMFDTYPYPQPPENVAAEYLHERYFRNLEIVRKVCLREGVPYWTFVQAFESDGYRRFPSESDLRMQVFSSLAYGFTGISYFTFDHAFKRALLEGETAHRPTRLYHDATRLNAEVKNLGKALRFLTSTDVRYVPGRHEGEDGPVGNLPPEDVQVYQPGAGGVRQLRSVTVQGVGIDRNGMIGFFKDDAGADYLLVVNLRHGPKARAADAVGALALQFDPAVKAVWRLSRETGRPEKLPVVGGKLIVELPGGTGDLFKIADGQFPGL